MKAQEMIDYINSQNIHQTDHLPMEDIFSYIEESGGVLRAEDLSINKHRRYETSVTVFEINGEYFGIRSVLGLYDRWSLIETVHHTLKAIPVKLEPRPTYVIEE